MNKIIIFNKDGKYFGEIFCDEKKRIVIKGTDKNVQVFLEKTLQKILKQGVKVRQEKIDVKDNIRTIYIVKVDPENPLYLLALSENLRKYMLTGIVLDGKRANLSVLIKESELPNEEKIKLLLNLRSFSDKIISELKNVFLEAQNSLEENQKELQNNLKMLGKKIKSCGIMRLKKKEKKY